jgi:hypothetical protein
MESLRKFPDLSVHNVLRVMGKGPKSAGNQNKLYHMVKLILPLLNPNLSAKEKLVSVVGGDAFAEDRIKYIL